MGHEYVEIKNTHAAVISYKRAVGKTKIYKNLFKEENLIY
jgi:hypothetical protein